MNPFLAIWLICAAINVLLLMAVLWLDDCHTYDQRRRLVVECLAGSAVAAPLVTMLLLFLIVVLLAIVLTGKL